jgi:hypothetical protein
LIPNEKLKDLPLELGKLDDLVIEVETNTQKFGD